MINIKQYIENNYSEFKRIITRQLKEQNYVKQSFKEDILHDVLIDIIQREDTLKDRLTTEKKLLGYIINSLNLNTKSSSAPSRKYLNIYNNETSFFLDEDKDKFLDIIDDTENQIEDKLLKEKQIEIIMNYQSQFYVFDWLIYINSFFNNREEVCDHYGIYRDYYTNTLKYINYGIKYYSNLINHKQLEDDCENIIIKNKNYKFLDKQKLFLLHNKLYGTNYTNIHKKEDFITILGNLKNYFYN